MKLRLTALVSTLALLACVSMAHGNKKHVIGTVEKVDAGSIVVKTAKEGPVTVKLVAATMYVTKDDKPAKLADVAVGDRVVIHATPKGETLEAAEVKFSHATAAASAAKP